MTCADELLSIGQFAQATGLTPKALRHYDAAGLLVPAQVTPGTGYRRYDPGQVAAGQLIRRLRDVGLPLAEIRRLLDQPPDGGVLRPALLAHRRRLLSRVTRMQRQMHDLDHLIADGEKTRMTELPALDSAAHRKLGAALFNHTWTLLENEYRSAEEDAEMMHAAHASAWHWMQAATGEPVRRARSEWQCSRVYAVLGRPEPAMFHARNVLAICAAHGIADFDLAFAHEALARAASVAGDLDAARRHAADARAASAGITEDHDRELLLSDLATLPAGV